MPSNNNHAAALQRKIENKSARIGIVGLGAALFLPTQRAQHTLDV